jgi:BMFP domain-containing protein YqiC
MYEMIEDVCSNVVKIMQHIGLDRFLHLPYRILPDAYKHGSKNNRPVDYYDILKQQIPELESNIIDPVLSNAMSSQIQFAYEDIDKYLDVSNMSTSDLQRIYASNQKLHEDLVGEFQRRNIEIDVEKRSSNALDELKRIEREKFKKAQIGKPIVTYEEMSKDQQYVVEFEKLKNVLKALQKGFGLIYEWFINKYIPISVEDVIKFRRSYEFVLEMHRPFFDRKYRVDHYDAVMLSFEKLTSTSQKASKLSRVPCANTRDKRGNIVWRGLTKEQIEAMTEWEIMFWREYINHTCWYMHEVSDVFKNHTARCIADRAVELGPYLSHLS